MTVKERLLKNAALKRRPFMGALELTPICNFRCKMCYVRKSPEEVREAGGLLPVEFWIDKAKQAKEAGVLVILLTGGEPFLYPDFWKLYHALMEMGMEVSINSNGSCITEEVIAQLKKNPPIRINLTLYGGSNETYEKMCGDPKGFDKVHQGIELLKKNHIRFKFNCSLMPENASDLKKMIDFSKSYGMNLKVTSYMVPPVRRLGMENRLIHRLSARESAYYQVLTDWYQLSEEDFQKLACLLPAIRN